jgi:hypothetical protein
VRAALKLGASCRPAPATPPTLGGLHQHRPSSNCWFAQRCGDRPQPPAAGHELTGAAWPWTSTCHEHSGAGQPAHSARSLGPLTRRPLAREPPLHVHASPPARRAGRAGRRAVCLKGGGARVLGWAAWGAQGRGGAGRCTGRSKLFPPVPRQHSCTHSRGSQSRSCAPSSQIALRPGGAPAAVYTNWRTCWARHACPSSRVRPPAARITKSYYEAQAEGLAAHKNLSLRRRRAPASAPTRWRALDRGPRRGSSSPCGDWPRWGGTSMPAPAPSGER